MGVMVKTQKYNFIDFANDSNYRYYCHRYDKKNYIKYVQSYSSEAANLNKSMYLKVLRHKQILDRAIASVESQIKRGFTFSTVIHPSELRKEYRWYVNQFVKNKLKMATTQKDTNGSQKYWVPAKAIKTYGFRNKDLTSKFQCFVEFVSADKNETDTVKLNLSMSKKAFENRRILYKDGFDLVFRDKSVFVRHVSEKLVKKKDDNGITRYMTIDAWSNISSVIVNEKLDTSDMQNLYALSDNDKLVYGVLHRTRNTSNMKKALTRMKSMEHKEVFYEDIQRLYHAIHSKVRSVINRDDESKVVIFIPDGIQSKLYSLMTDKFVESVKDECKKYGISVNVQAKHITEVKDTVFSYRQKANDVALGFKPYKEKQLKSHLKWSEVITACIISNYKNCYPALYSKSKSTIDLGRRTEKNDSRALRPERPVYAKLFDAKRLYTIDDVCDEVAARAMWLSIVKSQAKEYYIHWLALNNEQPEQLTTNDYDEPVFV